MNPLLQNFLLQQHLSRDTYAATIQSCIGFSNKQDFLDPETAWPLAEMNWDMLPYMERDHCNYWIEPYGYLLEVSFANGIKKQFLGGKPHMVGVDWGVNTSVVRKIFDDKIYTKRTLARYAYNVASDCCFLPVGHPCVSDQTNKNAVLQQAAVIGYPLIWKPCNACQGRGVKKIYTSDQLRSLLEQYEMSGDRDIILIEQCIIGTEYRLTRFADRLFYCYKKTPPHCMGDGVSSVHDLLQDVSLPITAIDAVWDHLQQQGLSPTTILAPYEVLPLLPVANLHFGGTITHFEPPVVRQTWAKGIAEIFGATFFGIDLILPDGSLMIEDGVILEINCNPGIKEILPHQKKRFLDRFWEEIRKGDRLLVLV